MPYTFTQNQRKVRPEDLSRRFLPKLPLPDRLGHIHNQRANPLKKDPTRTTTIRLRFQKDMRRRFKRLRAKVVEFMVTHDALGLGPRRNPMLVTHASIREFQFRTDAGKVTAFQEWFAQQVKADIFSAAPGTDPSKPWTTPYVTSAYKQGQLNAYLATRSALDQTDPKYIDQTQAEFLRSSFNQPETLSKIQLLATRSYSDLNGVTAAMGTQMNRALAQGIADGAGPDAIAKEMTDTIDNLTDTRALLIARTECLPGDTLVDGAIVNRAFRRWYEGLMVEIKTRNGRKFSATPNHPMLTRDGWIGAGNLNQTHYLVCDGGRNKSVLSANPNIQRSPALISEIFDSIVAIGVGKREVTSHPDFHGDGLKGEVDIFSADRELEYGNFSALSKELVERSFSPAGFAASSFCLFCHRLLPVNESECLCAGSQQPKLIEAAAYQALVYLESLCDAWARFSGFVTAYDFRKVLLQHMVELIRRASLFPSECLSLGVCSVDSRLADYSSHPRPVPSFLFRDLPAAKSGQIEFDNVISVELRQFSGHIFNLQTPVGYFTIEGGAYTGNTIYAHAEGQLDAFDRLGVQELGVKAEWSTAGDDRVCPKCQDMEGKIFDIEEASGLIPLHPDCRCSWIPASLEDQVKVAAQSEPAPAEPSLIEEPALVEAIFENVTSLSDLSIAGQSVPEAEVEALYRYQQSGFLRVNEELREGKSVLSTDKRNAMLAGLDTVMEKSTIPKDIFTYRGVELSLDLTPGTILEDKAFVSTSIYPQIAIGFSPMEGGVAPTFVPIRKGTLLKIRIPKGSNGIVPSSFTNGYAEVEGEVLLPRGTNFLATGETDTIKGMDGYEHTFQIVNLVP